MDLEIAADLEPLVADVANMRLEPGVGHLVDFEIAFAGGGEGAVGAEEGFLPGVHHLVPLEVEFLREALAAVGAAVGLLAAVEHLVGAQVDGVLEDGAADVAHVGVLAVHLVHVRVEGVLVGVILVAQGARQF